MRVAIVSTAEIAACHDILSPEFWINQRLKAEWDGRSAADRAMAVAHYKQQMATARSLRDQAEALVDHARMIEADVAHLTMFVKREVRHGKASEPDPDT